MGVLATDFANLAVEKAQRVPSIPYVLGGRTEAGTDCSNLIWLLMRELGGTDIRAGSNTIWASHVVNKAFRNTGGALHFNGILTPGALLFIDYHNPVTQTAEGTPGAMDHMGIYVGNVPGLLTPDGKQGNVVHASLSRGMVCASTLLNAWTHGAYLKYLDYDGAEMEQPDDPELEPEPEPEPEEPATPVQIGPGPGQAMINTKDTGLLLRKQPNKKGAVIKEMPKGHIVQVLSQFGEWTQVRFVNFDGVPHVGWCMSSYLLFGS